MQIFRQVSLMFLAGGRLRPYVPHIERRWFKEFSLIALVAAMLFAASAYPATAASSASVPIIGQASIDSSIGFHMPDYDSCAKQEHGNTDRQSMVTAAIHPFATPGEYLVLAPNESFEFKITPAGTTGKPIQSAIILGKLGDCRTHILKPQDQGWFNVGNYLNPTIVGATSKTFPTSGGKVSLRIVKQDSFGKKTVVSFLEVPLAKSIKFAMLSKTDCAIYKASMWALNFGKYSLTAIAGITQNIPGAKIVAIAANGELFAVSIEETALESGGGATLKFIAVEKVKKKIIKAATKAVPILKPVHITQDALDMFKKTVLEFRNYESACGQSIGSYQAIVAARQIPTRSPKTTPTNVVTPTPKATVKPTPITQPSGVVFRTVMSQKISISSSTNATFTFPAVSGVNYRLIVQSPATWGSFHCDFTAPSGVQEAGSYYCTGVSPGRISARTLLLDETGQYSGVLTFGKPVTGDIVVTIVEEPTTVTTIGSSVQVPLMISGARVRLDFPVRSGIPYRVLVENPPNTSDALGIIFDPLGKVAFPDLFYSFGIVFSSGRMGAYSFVPNQTGTYSLALEFSNPAVTGKISARIVEETTLNAKIGTSVNIPLTSPGDRAHVSFPVQSGVTYRIKIQSPPHTDVLDLLLLDPFEIEVDHLWPFGDTYVHDFVPNQTGNYSVAVSFRNPAVTGRVSITISKG